jgi:hypothetical protein
LEFLTAIRGSPSFEAADQFRDSSLNARGIFPFARNGRRGAASQ